VRVSKSKLAASAIALAMVFAAPAFAGNNGNNGNNGNHYGNHTNQDGVEVTVNAELDIDNDSSAVATGGAGGMGGTGGSAVSTSSATGGAGGNANAWGGAGGNSNATGGNSESNATGGSAVAAGGNATGGNSNATGGNATGGNATGGNATGGSADNSSVNSSNNTLTSNNTNTNDANNTLNNANTNSANNTLNNANSNDASNTLNNANTNSADNSSSATGGNASADNNGNNNGNGNGNNNGNNNSSSSNSQGQSQSANNDNANSNNSDQSVEVNTYNERNPVSTAYAAPLVSGEDTCMGSSTLGAQAVSFGVSIGTTWQDANCRRLKNSRQLVALGYHGAATALMCVDEDVRHAMEAAGTPCPSRDNPQPQVTPVSAPAPTPAPCPTNDFVVPFEWDRSNLNRTAVRIIDDAVTRARQCNVNAVVVIGHTDTSGSNAYNTALSQRRAVVVRNAMIDRGVSADLIETASRGETDPALMTGNGIREAANRRTAVTISFR
jgi:outer membrane protein OmpA-like peptidoglycan-associated protein